MGMTHLKNDDSFHARPGWNRNSILDVLELPETCSFLTKNKCGKIIASVGFIKKKFVTVHGHVNAKKKVTGVSKVNNKHNFSKEFMLPSTGRSTKLMQCRVLNSMGSVAR
jgi:hypothetical protein